MSAIPRPFVMLGQGQGGTYKFADGTAAAPSITFANRTDSGFFRESGAIIGIASGGAMIFRLRALSGAGEILGPNYNQAIGLGQNGDIYLTAAGTNQNITLTPSGTGGVMINSGNNTPGLYLQESGSNKGTLLTSTGDVYLSTTTAGKSLIFRTGAATTALTLDSSQNANFPGVVVMMSSVAIPAGGTTGIGMKFTSTSNFGVFCGSGAPTLSAAKGSLYLRSDGSSTSTRAYINTDGGGSWTAITTAA